MILIALGANLPSPAGPPEATIRAALRDITSRNVSVAAVSSLFRSAAWPDPADPPFVNAVAWIETACGPANLLDLLKQTERGFGRRVSVRNAPRPLDLDVLDYDGRIEGGPPTLPHPRLHVRGFVLVPLREVAPDWNHPVCGLGVEELIARLPPPARALTRLA